MKALVVGIGLATLVAFTSDSPILGSGGTALAFGAGSGKTYDSTGHALTRHQLSVKKLAAKNKTKQN